MKIDQHMIYRPVVNICLSQSFTRTLNARHGKGVNAQVQSEHKRKGKRTNGRNVCVSDNGQCET